MADTSMERYEIEAAAWIGLEGRINPDDVYDEEMRAEDRIYELADEITEKKAEAKKALRQMNMVEMGFDPTSGYYFDSMDDASARREFLQDEIDDLTDEIEALEAERDDLAERYQFDWA